MKIECLNGPVLAGENDARVLTLTVETPYRSHSIRLGLRTPAGRRYLTPEITLTDGLGTYPLPAAVLDAPGMLLAQIIAENAGLQVVKSEIFAFPVERSIPAEAAETAETGLITLGSVNNAVLSLTAAVEALAPVAQSGSYTDLTDRPAIPAVPENVSAFTNDAGYLTAHQSLAAYSTTAQMNAAIAAAVLDAAGIAVDGSLVPGSENPVQSKVLQAALENKQEKLTAATGTFTPNYTPGTGNNLTVKQVGNVVYLQGYIVPTNNLADASGHHLGDISGVAAPSNPVWMLPVTTTDGNDTHPGYIGLVSVNDSIYVGMTVDETDTVMIIDAFYLV